MAEAPNTLERKSILLAQKAADTTARLARQLGAGGRPAYTVALTSSESDAWWREHLQDDWGKKAMEALGWVVDGRPTAEGALQMTRLNARMGRYVEAQQQANAYLTATGRPSDGATGRGGASVAPSPPSGWPGGLGG